MCQLSCLHSPDQCCLLHVPRTRLRHRLRPPLHKRRNCFCMPSHRPKAMRSSESTPSWQDSHPYFVPARKGDPRSCLLILCQKPGQITIMRTKSRSSLGFGRYKAPWNAQSPLLQYHILPRARLIHHFRSCRQWKSIHISVRFRTRLFLKSMLRVRQQYPESRYHIGIACWSLGPYLDYALWMVIHNQQVDHNLVSFLLQRSRSTALAAHRHHYSLTTAIT